MAVFFDPDRKVRFQLTAEVTGIGRSPANAIQLDDPLVAPLHAEVRRGPDGRYRLVDLGSRRGTFHASRRVSQSLLADGDEVLIGGVRLRFEEPPAQALAPAPLYPPAAAIDDVAQLRRDYDKLRAAFELSQGLAAAHDLHSLLPAVLQTAFRVLRADRGIIVLLDPQTLQPMLQVAQRRDGEPGEIPISTNLLSEIIQKREGVITADTGLDERFNRSQSLFNQSVRSAMCVPMVHQGELVGAIQVDSQQAVASFERQDLEMFTVIASQAAAAIHDARLTAKVHSVVADERARLGRLIGDLPDGVLLLDAGRRPLLQNRRAVELLAPLGGAAPGQVVDALAHIEIAELLAARCSVDLPLGGPHRQTLALQATESQGPLGSEVVVLIRDVTAERERDALTAQDDRLKVLGQLAGGVAHDFNNILAVISNFAAFALDGEREPEQRADIEQILQATTRAAALTRRLLAFGRREPLRLRVLTIESVLAGMEPLLRGLLGAAVRLKVLCAEAPWRVKADPTLLEQVVLNLAVNARDAMPAEGDLLLETSQSELSEAEAQALGLPPGRVVTLLAKDTGVGMTPEVAARVFEPFFTTKEHGKGTGLGLATVFGIVTQVGGVVRLSTEPGKGASFRVLLPATTEEPKFDELRTETLPATVSVEVLVAEDDPAVREIIRRVLESAGYRVRCAADADAALRLSSEGPVELLVTDLVMPGMGGKQLAQELRAAQPGLPVLFISAYFEDGQSAMADGGDFLPKPFSREELLAQVRRTLGSAVGR